MQLRSIALIAAVAILPTLAGAAEMEHHSTAAGSEAEAAFTTANDKMMKDMMVAPTGDVDADFVAMMIPHHQGAIDMALVEVQFGKDPVLRAMAESIIKAQEEEIATMKKWQQGHGK